MYVDALLMVDEQDEHLTSEASTDYIDLGTARNLGVGEDLYVVALVTTAFTDGSSNSTMALKLESDNDAAFGSVDASQSIGTFAALSAVGTRLVAKLQPDMVNSRYLRAYYTVANGDLTTGKFTVFITKDIDAFTAYADAITIA